MKSLILFMFVMCSSLVASAEVTVCGNLQGAPSAGKVYGQYVIESGEVYYYIPTDDLSNALKTQLTYLYEAAFGSSQLTTNGPDVCISGELTLVEGTVIPIAQIRKISKIQ